MSLKSRFVGHPIAKPRALRVQHHQDSAYSRRGPRALARDEQPAILCQGGDTSICGQCCVAMLLDCPVDTVVNLMAVGGGTRTKDLVACLRAYYPDCPDTLERVQRKLTRCLTAVPAYCIAKLTFDEKASGHWIIRWRDFIYDPSYGVIPLSRYGAAFINERVRVTSYLPIYPKGRNHTAPRASTLQED